MVKDYNSMMAVGLQVLIGYLFQHLLVGLEPERRRVEKEKFHQGVCLYSAEQLSLHHTMLKGGGQQIADLSCGLPPYGRVPGLGLRIADLKFYT
jgi:hypothetical protein